MKAIYDEATGKSGTSDLAIKVALSEFLDTTDTTEARASIIYPSPTHHLPITYP